MTQRERILAGCLLGAVVGYGGYKLIQSQVVEPRRELRANIRKERARQSSLRDRLGGASRIVSDWQERTGLTLGRELSAVHRAFGDDVNRLLEQHNLTQVENWTIRPMKEHREKKPPREGFVELPLSVRVGGKLSDLVGFLRDLYQRPYDVRVDKLSLASEKGRTLTRRKRRGAADEPELSITMTLSTLVLPKAKDVEHPTLDLESVDDPNSAAVLAMALRLAEEDLDEYDQIAEVNFFQLYKEPTREIPKPVTAPVVRDDDKPPPPPPPDKRRDAHKYVVHGVGHLPDGPVAYVINTDDALEPATGYRLNDEVDDGKLVLIVPEGIVVRVAAEEGPREPPKDYFYPLGASFKEREEVQPTEHPDVARLLRLVLKD